MKAYDLPKNRTTYNYRYFLPYAPEWGTEEFCNRRLKELIEFCHDAKVDAVQFYVNTLPGTYYMPAHSAKEQLQWAEWMRDTANPAMRKAGFSYQLNYQMLLGAGSCGLDMRDEYGWEFLVNQYGDESLGCACPLGGKFREIMGEMLRLWASTNPDIIWIDDDFRLHNHGLATPRGDCDFYCYCEKHLSEFAKFAGREYSREELVSEILKPGKPSELRGLWMDFLGRTMVESADWVRRQIQDVSPETRLALMTSCPDVHSAEGRDWKKMMNSLSGIYKPMTRPMCGVYTGTTVPVKLNTCTYKYMSQSMDTLRQIYGVDGIEFGSELENTRFTTWSKSVANSKYVMVLGQLLGAPQITLSINDLDGSSISDEPTTVPLLKNTKPLLDALAALNLRKWEKKGVVFINDPRSARKCHLDADAKMQDMGLLREWEDIILQCGVPAYHTSCAEAAEKDDILVLEGYTAWSPSDDELRKILSHSVLLDGDAAYVLQQRGFGEFTGVKVGQRQPFAVMAEKYKPGILPGIEGRIPHRGYKWRLVECDGAIVTSEFIDAQNRYFPGGMIFENKLGGRVATYASIGDFSYGTFFSHLRVKWVHAILAWLSNDTFPVLPMLPHHGLCVVRENQDSLIVALANLGTDVLENCSFRIHATSKPRAVHVLEKNGKWSDVAYFFAKKDHNTYELSLRCNLNVFEWLILQLKWN